MKKSPRPLSPSTRLLRASLLLLMAGCAALAASCSRGSGTPAPQAEDAKTEPETAAPAGGPSLTAAGVRWNAPERWQAGPERPMRVATYRIPAASGDPEDGECGVFYFGPGQGGGIDANLERWLGQFVREDGQPLGEVERREKRDIRGLPVTLVDVSGTYLFSPTPMSPDTTPKPGYRLLGVIVEAPEGNVFFKLTAPRATAEAAAPELEALLRSLERG